jgi:DNA-binding response OmpR family regulator
VLHARDGLAALHLRDQYSPDLVVLDWMIPALDGLEVLRRLRLVSPIPILMLTSRTEEADRVLGLELGADDYLTKPFSLRELVARVRALLRRMERVQQIISADRIQSAPCLSYQSLTLDVDQRQAMVGDQPVDLTPIEFNLLYLLLRHPGRIFSRSYLLETVWEETVIGGSRSVDNAVLRLRKKLGDKNDVIETVWGVGYRLKKAGGP